MTRCVLLLGSDHTELGEVAIETLPPDTAIGISRGRFPKGYAHVDPNEDAVFASTDGATTVLVVADGHHGFDAARAAIQATADGTPHIIETDLEDVVRELATIATEAVAQAVPGLRPPRDTSRTALTICAIRNNGIAATTIGDTACLITTRRRVKRIGGDSQFLGPDTDRRSIRIETASAPPGSVIVVTSDGFVDFAASVDRSARTASKLPPEGAVETLVADAFAGGAGDNIAVAVHRSSA